MLGPPRARGEDPNGLPAPGRSWSAVGQDHGVNVARARARYPATRDRTPGAQDPVRPLIPPGARRAALHGLVIGGLGFLVYTFVVAAPRIGTVGFDAFAYWSVQAPDPYLVPVGSLGAFTYSPPMAMLFHLASGLEWWVFLWVWLAVLVATAIWLGGRRALLVLAFPPVVMELYHGNVNLLIAAAVVLGFRHPWTWSVVLLTKPTSGVGLLWFAARKEWRSLAIALGFTAAIAGVSLIAAPHMWLDWVGYLFANVSGNPGGAWVPIPLWTPPPGRRGAGGLGRPDRSCLDRARSHDHRLAGVVVRRVRRPGGAGPAPEPAARAADRRSGGGIHPGAP